MKKSIIGLAVALLASMALLAACSSGSGASSSADTAASSAASSAAQEAAQSSSEPEASASATSSAAQEASSSASSAAQEASSSADEQAASSSATEGGAASGEVDPYAWLGLQDMPKCNYLDIFSTYHYIQTYDTYVMGLVTEETEAMDGVNSYTVSDNNRSYSVDGKIYSINENSKMYMEADMGSTAEVASEELAKAQKEGKNLYGRNFVETGSGKIPQYSDTGDTAEYEYYEFNYPDTEALGTKLTERWYMKDGDVFAIATNTDAGGTQLESVKVIKSISGDIPEGTFDIPDLSEYSKYE